MVWSENLNKPGSGRAHFVHLARGLASCGNQVRIVAPGYPPRTDQDLGLPVSYVPTLRRSMVAFLLFHALLLPAMPYLILRYRPEVVYTRGLFHSFLMHVICRLMRTCYVAEVDSIVDLELAMRGLPRFAIRLVHFFDRWNLRWASGFICVTEGLRAELIRRGTKPKRVFAVHNGAAVDIFSPGDQAAARQELDLPQDAVLVGFVGTLSAYQGLDLLIDAAALCPQDDQRPTYFVVVGDGERRPMVEEAIARHGLGHRFLLRGAVPHERVLVYLRALDLEVISVHDARTTRYGLSSLKFWEALAVGLPVLVPDSVALGDVLAGLNWPGQYPTGEARGLSDKITETIARLDEFRGRRDQLHEVVRRDHSWQAVAHRSQEVFESLIQ
ncbi:MAG: glycosyltransferase [Anaerolineaceae bacterium]|nr:glycosyltransferase [Anaerolineaceae bacterium]